MGSGRRGRALRGRTARGVVARVEVDLGEPEGVVIVPWEGQRASRVELKGGRRREVGTNLSAPGVCPR